MTPYLNYLDLLVPLGGQECQEGQEGQGPCSREPEPLAPAEATGRSRKSASTPSPGRPLNAPEDRQARGPGGCLPHRTTHPAVLPEKTDLLRARLTGFLRLGKPPASPPASGQEQRKGAGINPLRRKGRKQWSARPFPPGQPARFSPSGCVPPGRAAGNGQASRARISGDRPAVGSSGPNSGHRWAQRSQAGQGSGPTAELEAPGAGPDGAMWPGKSPGTQRNTLRPRRPLPSQTPPGGRAQGPGPDFS